MLTVTGSTVRYSGTEQPSLAGVSAEVRPGRLLAVVGPNGSGKTTLLRAMLGAVRLQTGTVELDGRPIADWPARERARRVGAVAQREEYPFAWRVDEVVMFGRYPWLAPLQPPGVADGEVVATAMARCDVTRFARRRIGTLSGGEWQRVRIARALAQEPRLLLLDEPTASLDLGHEMELFELIRDLVGEGLGAAVVTHHLNVAARFADELLLLAGGRAEAHGSPEQVLDPVRLSRVFGWPVRLGRAPEGAPQIVAERRARS